MARLFLVLLPIAILISILSPYIFSVSEDNNFEVQMMFFMVIVASLIASFSTGLDSVYMAHNYLYKLYFIRMVHCLAQVGFIILFFILFGPSLILLGLAYIVAAVLLIGWLLIGVKRIDPEIKIDHRKYDRKSLKEMYDLGIWGMVIRLGNILFIQTSQIVVNISLGSEIQGEFSIAANVISMISTTCIALVAVGVPLLYVHYNNKDKPMFITTLGLFTKFVGLLMSFPLAYLFIFAPQVLETWLGTTYTALVTMVMVMMPICVVKSSMEILPSVAVVHKNVRNIALGTVAFGILNIILAIVLIQCTDLGVIGACVAWDVSMGLLTFVFYPLTISHLMDISMIIFVKSLIVDYISFGVMVGLGLLFCEYYTLPSGWISIMLSFVSMFLVFFIAAMRLGLNKEERGIVITYFPQFMQKYLSKLI